MRGPGLRVDFSAQNRVLVSLGLSPWAGRERGQSSPEPQRPPAHGWRQPEAEAGPVPLDCSPLPSPVMGSAALGAFCPCPSLSVGLSSVPLHLSSSFGLSSSVTLGLPGSLLTSRLRVQRGGPGTVPGGPAHPRYYRRGCRSQPCELGRCAVPGGDAVTGVGKTGSWPLGLCESQAPGHSQVSAPALP